MTAAEVIAGALDALPADVRPVQLVNRDRADVALEALRAAGYAVVELPKPDDDSRWHIEDVGDISTYPRGGVGIKNIGNDLVVADCEARNLAAVLLAAAAAAEADA